MLQVTTLRDAECPFPRHRPRYHRTAIELKHEYGLTSQEIADALETGEPARGIYLIEFAPFFLEQMEQDDEIDRHGPFSTDEIAEIMQLHTNHVKQILHRARRKLARVDALRDLADSVRPHLGDDERYRVTVTTTVDVEE